MKQIKCASWGRGIIASLCELSFFQASFQFSFIAHRPNWAKWSQELTKTNRNTKYTKYIPKRLAKLYFNGAATRFRFRFAAGLANSTCRVSTKAKNKSHKI